MKNIFFTLFDTNHIGKIILYGDKNYLYGLEFYKDGFIKDGWIEDDRAFQTAIKELELYFNKEIKRFNVPIKPIGTNFQKRVWRELLKIPYGTTISYQELAKSAGNPKASRAVGNANGKNPIAIIIPCHRVISKNGTIGGFSGGVEIKKELLKLEGVEIV